MSIRKMLAVGFVATMVLGACGGGGSARDELIKELDEQGDVSDEQKDCVKGVADGYSDSELEEIKKETEDAETADFDTFSEKSKEFLNGLTGCMTGDGSAMIDEIINGLPDEVTEEARECIRAEFTDIDAEQLASLAGDQTEILDLVSDCMLGG